MKYCSKCGHELSDDTVFCPSCGAAQNWFKQGEANDNQTSYAYAASEVSYNSAKALPNYNVILAFLIIPLVFVLFRFGYSFTNASYNELYEQLDAIYGANVSGASLSEVVNFSLAVSRVIFVLDGLFIIAMIVVTLKKKREQEFFSIAVGVLTLLFAGLIAGIMMLVANNKKNR